MGKKTGFFILSCLPPSDSPFATTSEPPRLSVSALAL
jgi:hypothetical protein